MNLPKNNAITAISVLFLTCCAHAHRATVAMKLSPTEAHIGLGSSEVEKGDRVSFFEHKCHRPEGGILEGVENDPTCTKVRLGGGTITRVLDQQYSVVHIDAGVNVKEGTVVETGRL